MSETTYKPSKRHPGGGDPTWRRIFADLHLQAALHQAPFERFALARLRAVLRGRDLLEGRRELARITRRRAA